MGAGHQPPSPEWIAICDEVRRAFIEVCPLSNRRFNNQPGTFRRAQIAELSGVSLANMRRLVDERLPCDPATVLGLADFLGMRITLERDGPLPTPSPTRPKVSPRGQRRSRKVVPPRRPSRR